MRIVAVSEVTRYLKDLMEEDYFLQDVWIQGEVTNYTQSTAGHRYFSLKDATASLRCVLFRGSAGNIPPLRNGMAIIAHGRMSIYEQRGDYQFYVDAVEDAGLGLLHQRFERLKARLEAEGLFAEERKRPIPLAPSAVGVVTSVGAAALRDVLRTLRLRYPLLRVVLAPTLVQGEGAAEQIADALDSLNAHGEVEVIIVARGGGSLEELWAFNEEVVARAIARSLVPVVTGVGHETDFTIADFVADLRASTPTAAAAAVSPDARTMRVSLLDAQERLRAGMIERIASERDAIETRFHLLERASPQRQINDARQYIDGRQRAMNLCVENLLRLRGEQLRGAALRLNALSPLLTIGRGFAVVRRGSNGDVITSVKQITSGQSISVMVSDGTFHATVSTQNAPRSADVASSSNSASQTAATMSTRGASMQADLLNTDGKRVTS